MSREDILRMADEAYELAKKDLLNGNYLTTGFLAIRDIHFYRLATTAEREQCAKLCDDLERKKWETITTGGELTGVSARDCAAAIRARGEE